MKLEEIKEAVEIIKAYRQRLTDSVSTLLDGDIAAFDMAIEAMERESKESEYKRAFKVACELLNDDYLYGYDRDRIYAEVMQAEGVFSSEDYERYILEHLDNLSGCRKER